MSCLLQMSHVSYSHGNVYIAQTCVLMHMSEDASSTRTCASSCVAAPARAGVRVFAVSEACYYTRQANLHIEMKRCKCATYTSPRIHIRRGQQQPHVQGFMCLPFQQGF